MFLGEYGNTYHINEDRCVCRKQTEEKYALKDKVHLLSSLRRCKNFFLEHGFVARFLWLLFLV
jgi:hypothetical protein